MGLLGMNGDTDDLREYRQSIREDGPPEPPPRIYDTPVLPPEFRSLSRQSRSPFYNEALRYLESRGFGMEDVVRWKLGYCEDGEYRHRIILPSFDADGELNFFVGRAYRSNVGMNYKHGNFSKDIIWNDYMVDWTEPIVITEGSFDAFRARDNVIALQGTIMGPSLFSKIVRSEVPVFFAEDSDAFAKQIKQMEKLVMYGIKCRHVDLDGKKDVGEMTYDEFIHAKNNAIAVESDLDILKIRVRA